jgi:hypothetical protein
MACEMAYLALTRMRGPVWCREMVYSTNISIMCNVRWLRLNWSYSRFGIIRGERQELRHRLDRQVAKESITVMPEYTYYSPL